MLVHTTDAATVDVTTGRKYSARSTPRPCNGKLSSSATPSASPISAGTTSAINLKVLVNACWKLSS